jgi:lipoate-protein ligase B
LLDLGVQDYKSTWELQQRLVEQRLAEQITDSLILVEHPHVFTLGRRGDRSNLLSNDLPVFHVERGGDVTYHGPGQLVGYPILKLQGREQDIRDYLNRLEEVIIRTVSEFGLKAEHSDRQTGVWVGEKKVASIGVAIKSWVTYHGFALNVNTDLSYFGKIRPCGLESSALTSMQALIGSPLEMEEVKTKVKRHFSMVFHRKLLTIDRGIQFEPQTNTSPKATYA